MDETTPNDIDLLPTVILRPPKVVQRTDLARSTTYRLVASNDLPAQVQLKRQAVGWYERDIETWMKQRAREKST